LQNKYCRIIRYIPDKHSILDSDEALEEVKSTLEHKVVAYQRKVLARSEVAARAMMSEAVVLVEHVVEKIQHFDILKKDPGHLQQLDQDDETYSWLRICNCQCSYNRCTPSLPAIISNPQYAVIDCCIE